MSFSRHPRAFVFVTVVVLAIAASAPSLTNGFALDDVAIIAANARVHSLHQWWKLFSLSYWPPQFGASLYRPLVVLGFAFQWAAGGGAPWLFHLTSVVLYAGLCGLVATFLLELTSPTAALIAGALFAVHPVHVEAVGNVVGQSELIVAVAMLGACVIFLQARRRVEFGVGSVAAIAILFGLGCLSKEHGLLLPLLLAAVELFVVPDAGPTTLVGKRERIRAIAPLFVLLALIGIAYLGIRTAILGGLLGEKHVVPVYGIQRIWVMLAVVPQWVRLLAWPAHLAADYNPQQIAIPSGAGIEIVPGIAILVATVLAFVALGRATAESREIRSAARLGLAWMAVMLLPVSNLFSVMIVEERTLLMPSVGAALLVAVATQALRVRLSAPGQSTALRSGLTIACGCLVLAGLVRSAERQRVWRDDVTLFAQTVEDAPRSYRAQFFYGQLLFGQGKRAEGERHLRLAIALNPTASDVSPLNFLATEYRDAGMCPQAVPLYQRALASDAQRPDVRYGLAACLLTLGRIEDARRLAEDGVRRGDLRGLFLQLIARADSVGG